MAELAVDDQDGGQLDEAEIVRCFLVPARQHSAEAVKPRVRHLHHPAPRRMAIGVAGWGVRRFLRRGLDKGRAE